jgi:hypothetical protein
LSTATRLGQRGSCPAAANWNIVEDLEGGGRRIRKVPRLDITATVCMACNTGWMHRLEDQVRPFLGPLIAGKPWWISPRQQRLLARWVGKTVLVRREPAARLAARAGAGTGPLLARLIEATAG